MTAVPFDIDPVDTPLMMQRRPTNTYFRPLPPGAYESDARPVLARDVRAGDLILASFAAFPTPGRMTRGTTWVMRPYAAAPRPWNPTCTCTTCRIERDEWPPVPIVVLGAAQTDAPSGADCDVWEADEVALVIPAALLLIPVPA